MSDWVFGAWAVTAGWAVSVGSVVALIGVVAWLRWARGRSPQEDQDWGPEGFSVERYRPMGLLLADEEAAFLAAQPGCDRELQARFVRERRRIFRMYLRHLARDFSRLHEEARAMVAGADQQHADLVGVLLRQQVVFWRLRSALEVRLVLHSLGWSRVDVSALVAAIEAMRVDLARITVPVPAA